MTTINMPSIDGGSAVYWSELRAAHRLVRNVDRAIAEAKSAPMYIGWGYDQDGEPNIEENIEPYDQAYNAIEAVRDNITALQILEAQGRRSLLDNPF